MTGGISVSPADNGMGGAVAALRAQIGCTTEVGETIIRMTAAELGESIANVAAYVEEFGQLP